jgi:hypothetical protein
MRMKNVYPQGRASLLHPVVNMALVLLSLSSLAPGKHSVVLFRFHLNEALQQLIVADVIAGFRRLKKTPSCLHCLQKIIISKSPPARSDQPFRSPRQFLRIVMAEDGSAGGWSTIESDEVSAAEVRV